MLRRCGEVFQRQVRLTHAPPLKKTFKKVLVANRGEIAIRVFRTLKEQNIRSVAIFAEQDNKSLHRTKADESYQVGAGKEPVAAYLDIDSIIKIAQDHNVDAIHPGYGFLSERADFATKVRNAGIHFIGPAPEVMARMGDKVEARKSAIAAGVKVVPGTDFPITKAEQAVAFAEQYGTPIILKAAYGGGGRGMRRVDEISEVATAFEMASREALANFGNGEMFVEKYLLNPRHIEVQLMGDNYGNVVHFFERDCSIQRRHQKVVEIAPASGLKPEIRQKILDDAVKLAKFVGYQNAGTVEFLLDERGDHYFIEVNARLQVEHTVTEEITGHDLVKTQIFVAEGASLSDMGITQEKIEVKGSAIQCRVTTEDPAKGFQPDSGKVESFRTAEGNGVRIDGAAYTGCRITPFYDSLLLKITTRGNDHETAAAKMRRCLSETNINGVKTNIPFLANVVKHKDFLQGTTTTSFIDQNPELLDLKPSRQRGMQLIRFMAETAVNGSMTPLGSSIPPSRVQPFVPEPVVSTQKTGWKQILTEKGPAAFANEVRNHKGLLITDTTFRDAHQSLLATRVRTHDLLKIAPFVNESMPQLFSLENWGGATFDVCMKFLKECPWQRLETLREKIPNIPFQCLIRGANAMGYSNYPDNVIDEFCKQSVKSGMDVFRVFDSLNYLPNLQVGIEAVGKAGGVVEAAIAYTGDVGDEKRSRYDLDYYMKLVDQLVKSGTHILCIKDMAGVLKPKSARLLVSTIRKEYPNLPIHVHTHDTAGVGIASLIACAEGGADIVDAAVDSMSGMTSQPSLGSLVRSFANTQLNTDLSTEAVSKYNNYWEQTRPLYGPFECTATMKSGNSDVFEHEIPGGQYTNLQFQAFSLGLGHKFGDVCRNYIEANKAVGDISKVTPSSKVVGDLAQFMTQNNIATADELLQKADDLSFPESVKDYFRGNLGQPPYGFPKELQAKVLRGEKPLTERPGKTIPPLDFAAMKKVAEEKVGRSIDNKDLLSYVMFPADFVQMDAFRRKYGPVEYLPTDVFFAGPQLHKEFAVDIAEGKSMLAKLVSVSKVGDNANRDVMFEYNGYLKDIVVRDNEAGKGLKLRPKATLDTEIGAPMKGKILDIKVKVGDKVLPKQSLCVLSAMKMEMAVEAKVAGTVKSISVSTGEDVDAEDLIITIE